MSPPLAKTDPKKFSEGDGQKLIESEIREGDGQKLIESEIRDMISTLTRRLSDLQHHAQKQHPPHGSSRSRHHQHNHDADSDDDDRGVRVITLAGSNTGASMRGELDHDKSSPPLDSDKDIVGPLGTNYVNSNFQAINNSIMMGGSYSTNDPGVHMDITDYQPEQHHGIEEAMKREKISKEKKKEKASSKSDHHSDQRNSDERDS